MKRAGARRPKHPMSMLVIAAASAILCSAASAGSPESASSQDGVERAIWVPKQVHFVYQGFTTHYSCEGLIDKVRKALLQFGARKDLKVEEGACERPGGDLNPSRTSTSR